MAISELLEAFEAHPTDHRAFEALVRAVLDEEAELGLPILFERLPTWISDPARSPLIRVIIQLARAEPDQRAADLLYHHLGLLYWQQFGEEQKAEATFRKIKGPRRTPRPCARFTCSIMSLSANGDGLSSSSQMPRAVVSATRLR